MYYAGGWKVLQSQEAFGQDEVLVLPPVDFGRGAHVGGGSWQWGVSATSRNSEAANGFVEFLMQDEYLVRYSDAIGSFPSVESATPLTENYRDGGALAPVREIGEAFALLRPPRATGSSPRSSTRRLGTSSPGRTSRARSTRRPTTSTSTSGPTTGTGRCERSTESPVLILLFFCPVPFSIG